MMGQDIQINMSTTINDSVFVTGLANGRFQIAKTSIRMKMDMDAMGQQKSFDSDKKEDMEGELGEKLKNKIGTTVQATVNELGIVQITSEIKEEQDNGMGAFLSMNNDSASVAGYFLVSPPVKKINTGDSWKDSLVSPQNRTETIYTFMKAEKGIAFISFETKTGSDITTETNGMEVKVKMKTEGSGTLQVELASGLVLERKTETKLSGTSEVMGMEIPMSGETKTTVLITKH